MTMVRSPKAPLQKKVRPLVILMAALCAFTALHSDRAYAVLLSEQFKQDGSVFTGAVVSLDEQDATRIDLATVENTDYLVGVVVDDASGSLQFAKSGAQANVALSGEAEVYVTDVNGVVKTGDFVSVSWVEGLAMKASSTQIQKPIGIALEDYDESKQKQYGDVTTPEGTKSANVDIVRIRLFDRQANDTGISTRNGVEGFIQNLAGKDVSYAKILAGTLIFFLSLLIAGLFIISSIRGSFISIGRNPMASNSIYKSLLHVSGLSVIVILIGTALAYVVLVV